MNEQAAALLMKLMPNEFGHTDRSLGPSPQGIGDLIDRSRRLVEQERLVEALPLLYQAQSVMAAGAGGDLLAETRTLLATCHHRLGHRARAGELLSSLLDGPDGLMDVASAGARLLQTEAFCQAGLVDRAEQALAWLRALDASLTPEQRGEVAVLDADVLLARGRASDALRALEVVEIGGMRSGGGRAEARLALLRARGAWALGRRGEAVLGLTSAVTRLEGSGLQLSRGELFLQLGVYAGELDAGEGREGDPRIEHLPAAQYLAQALECFAERGSLDGLERVRRHFQRYGRRATDRVLDEGIARESQAVLEAQGALARLLERLLPVATARQGTPASQPEGVAGSASVQTELDALHREMTEALVRLSRRLDGLLTAAHGAVVERNQLQAVLGGVRRLASVELDAEALTREVVDLALAVVDADGVVLSLVSRSGELKAREVRNIDASSHEWRAVSERAWQTGAAEISSQGGESLRVESTESASGAALGRAVAVPIRQGDAVLGVLYVDRLLRRGLLSRRDLALLEVVAAQAGALLERQRMTWSLRMAARVRETTMEAISDGVLAVSMAGRIRSANTRACALLGRDRQEVEGETLGELPGLGELFRDLRGLLDLDGQVVLLPGGEVVLGVRSVRDDGGAQAGFVLTCTGMRRAQRTARRIVGTRARYRFEDILGAAPEFLEQVQLGKAAARSDSGVLITGESGTGKEVLAQAIHNGSRLQDGPFVGINCAAIPRDLLESELFGHEEGAFTGARRGGQPGKFELSEGGTILLDEIGDMPLEMQAKLLRVLQERRFQRVGGAREYLLRARIIATTNQDLEQLAAEQRFRSDLLFRLQVIHLQLPPLRQRREDIPGFVYHFLRRSAERMGKRVRRVAPHVMEAFVAYAWPGNVRELEYVVESEVNLVSPEEEELERLPPVLRPSRRRRRETLVGIHREPSGELRTPSGSMNLNDVEREVLVAALKEHRGSVPRVAKSLGVSRGTVYNKVKKYDLDLTAFRRTR